MVMNLFLRKISKLPILKTRVQMTTNMNSQQPSIRFTMEIENNNKIAFLDSSVYREPDGRLTNSVYRKPTHTVQYLACDSHHPQSKRGIGKCLYDRAKRLVAKPSVIAEEKKHLSSVLVSNGSPSSFVQKITKARTTPRRELVAEFKSTVVLSYVQGVSESLRRCLEQQGIRTVFKSDTTLRSHLVRPKDTVNPAKQDGVIYRIPCECEVYIGETERSIKEHDRDIRLARTQTSAVSEHAHNTGHYPIWNEVKFIDRDPHWHTRKVKEAIHIRLHPNNINRDSGIEIPESWMPTIKIHNNRRTVQQRTAEGTATRRNNGTIGESKCTNYSRPYRLKKTSSKQPKRRDLHLTWLHCDTNDNTLYYCIYHDEWQKPFPWSRSLNNSTPKYLICLRCLFMVHFSFARDLRRFFLLWTHWRTSSDYWLLGA